MEKHLIEQINTIEESIKTDISDAMKKNTEQLGKENTEISELYEFVKEKIQELEILEEQGSNNQLFLTLREQEKGVHDVVQRVQEMILSYKKKLLKFEKAENIEIESVGSISNVEEDCNIAFRPVKLQQAQVQPERVGFMPTFQMEITKLLKVGDNVYITDVAVTADNNLFLCNFQRGVNKIYVYRINQYNSLHKLLTLPSEPFGISVLTGKNKAVVTLPNKSYLQLINTKKLKVEKTIQVEEGCYGISTTGDYIAVGKQAKIKILKLNGDTVKNIVLSGGLFQNVCSLVYIHNEGSLFYVRDGHVQHIQLDSTFLNRHKVSEVASLAVDAQGHVYVSEFNKNEIQRLRPDGRFYDVVLTKSNGITTPNAIAFNANFSNFFVTNATGLVQMYDCKYILFS
ncbi:unnamed protein product [Mytilus coruscus]|uniref:TRIM2_3 n=1 Tax=Mytilus coruscus TaxID=42192 RepID=A0A6J8AEV8_MYTCO|nr:unnamed protein product [Mytilus coruscus]